MVRPEYGNSLAEIPGTICTLLDVESELDELDSIQKYDNVENVVLIFIDAFGYNQWKTFDAGLFKKAEEQGQLHKITSVFPSMTPATLTSLHTGLYPVEHSLLGWEMYYEELDMIIQTLPFVDRDWTPIDEIVDDADPEILFDGDPVYEKLEEAGVNTYSLLDEDISEGAYSEVVHGSTEIKSYLNVPDMALKLRKLLNNESGKKFIYSYMDEIDRICHKIGPENERVQIQLEAISENLKRELEKVGRETAEKTLIVFSADHGQIKTSEKIDLMQYEEVEERLKKSREHPITPSGSARSVYLHVKDGEVESLKNFLEENIDANIYRTENAVESDLFGDREAGKSFYSRVGELLVIPNGKKAVWYNEWDHIGDHGGLHEDEMYIPFSVTRLSDLT